MSPLHSLLPLLALLSAATCCSYFDSYNGAKLTDQQLQQYQSTVPTSVYCVNKIKACDEKEGRRVDGSCNNLKTPTAGTGHSGYLRLLKPVFLKNDTGAGFAVRKAVDGSALPNPRRLRTQVLAEGRVPSQVFTQLMSHLFVFAVSDIAGMSIQDTLNLVKVHPCCLPSAADSPYCATISVDAEDPVQRFSGVRCLNMTWPISFQSIGCRPSTTAPERFYVGTPFFDLSAMYGNNDVTLQRQRNYTGGLLNYQLTESGRHWPFINTSIPTNITGDGVGGLTAGPNYIFGALFWREHNRLAGELAKVNPCWTDDQLFNTSREINVATYAQILYYELLAPLMGKKNLQNLGVLGKTSGFRDVYDEKVLPAMILDSLYSLRWIHTTIDGTLDFYDANGTKVREYAVQNLALNTIALNTNEAPIKYVAQGSFRQPAAEFDNVIDPVMAEFVLGHNQQVADVGSDDVAKSRLLGLPPYIDYLAYCNKGVKVNSFDDLSPFMEAERIEVLENMYTNVQDIDLTTGLWSEKMKKGTNVPPTFYCLFSKLLTRTVVADRHWFERAKRPTAFNAGQLKEIRKATVARVMCDSADTVVEITPKAFLLMSEDNKMVPCDTIPKIDITKWADKTCSSSAQPSS